MQLLFKCLLLPQNTCTEGKEESPSNTHTESVHCVTWEILAPFFPTTVTCKTWNKEVARGVGSSQKHNHHHHHREDEFRRRGCENEVLTSTKEVPAQSGTKEMRSRSGFSSHGKCEGNLLAFFFLPSTLEVRPLYTYALSAVMIIPRESRSSFVLWRFFFSRAKLRNNDVC